MTEEEWLDGLRHLSPNMIIKTHFALQEKIKKHYKLRATGKNLDKAIQLCIQQIALAPLTAEAMRKKHEDQWEELNALKRRHGLSERTWPFVLPAHHGYRQYAVILRRQKDFDKLAEIEEKRKREGWAN
ncbi:hypothetical protein HP475_15060 [Serratia marcescens]|uniref:hypothetical protein n=1 Tax=Serratia marcescens TaxID=615 RepID=UPI0007606279|nr:hypothetical protein [Serratia marcescens]QLJ61154.1 hypothetical protein HP475_15060 [Serratia marcescens]